VVGEHHRIGLALLLQPRGRQPVAEDPISTTGSRRCSPRVSAGARVRDGRERLISGFTPSAVSAAVTAAPSRGRCFGCLASIRSISTLSPAGTQGSSCMRNGAVSNRSLSITAIGCSNAKGACPVRHSNRTQPSENTSAAGVSSAPGRATQDLREIAGCAVRV